MAEGIRKINEFVMGVGRTLIITNEKNDFTSFAVGTLLINPAGDVKVKKENQVDWVNFTPANLFTNKAISYNFIADKTLTNQQIANGTILNDNIKDSEIKSGKIANSAIISDKLATDSVVNEKIKNNTIKNDKLFDKTITGAKIANETITKDHLAIGCITSDKIAADAIKDSVIKDRSITGIKIALSTLTNDLLADGTIQTGKIADSAITTSKILNNAVTGPKILDSAVSTTKIANEAVTTLKIANNAVTTSKITDSSITTNKIANSAVTTTKIGDLQVTASKLATAVSQAINSSVKLDSSGLATVNGSLKVTKNFTCTGTVTANKVYNAVWNDLAEGYEPGEVLEPGMIVEIREDGKVYKATALSRSVVGVISNEYAACYGATEEEIAKGEKVAVGLIGKIHAYVKGPVKVGDSLVASSDGIGVASSGQACIGKVGKALESSNETGIHKVLCLIYPN